MAQYINLSVTWADNSSGANQDTEQEVQIYTDSVSFVPNIPVDYVGGGHAWMRLAKIAADATTTSFRLEAPATFVKIRVRGRNAHGVGPWSNPLGQVFSLAPAPGTNSPLAPSAVGLSVDAVITPPAEIPPEDPPIPPSSTTYAYASQFSGVQGQSGWSWRDTSDRLLTYDVTGQIWRGVETYLAIWGSGFHHGVTGVHAGPVLRWTAPANGSARITGEYKMFQLGGGATASIKHGATTIFTQTITNTLTAYPYDVTRAMTAGEYIDFILTEVATNVNNNTQLLPSIAFTTDGTTPADPTVSSLTASGTLNAGTVLNLTLTLSSAAISAASVSLSSSDPTKATVPATVTVGAGLSTAQVPVTGVAAGSSTVTATYNSTSAQSVITVTTPPVGGVWPNLPSGMTKVTDTPFDDRFPTEDGWWNVYNTFPFASPDYPGPRHSPPRALDQAMEVGSTVGNGWFGVSFPPSNEVYLGFYWATNPGFEGSVNSSNKMVFIRNAVVDNSLLSWMGLPDQPKTLRWFQQALVNNTHIPGVVGTNYPTDGTGWFTANVNNAAATMAAGTGFRLVEIYLKSSTTATSRNGIIRWWVGGVLCGEYTNVNLCPPGFNDFQMNTAWDGSSAFQVRDLSRAWHHYYDHVYLARRGDL